MTKTLEKQIVELNDTYQFADVMNEKRNGLLAKFINQRAGRECKTNPKQSDLLNQARLIQSELNELIENIMLGDAHAMRDDLGDILITTYGFEGLIPLNIDLDYRIDVEANLSRIDTTYQDAELTQQKYLNNGIETLIHKTVVDGITYFPVRTIDKTQVGFNGETFTPNKFAKSINFREPVYPPLTDYLGDEFDIVINKDIEEKYILINSETVHDGGHGAFWKKGNSGYTDNIDEAKQFTYTSAMDIIDDNAKGKFRLVKLSDAIQLSERKIKKHKLISLGEK